MSEETLLSTFASNVSGGQGTQSQDVPEAEVICVRVRPWCV